MSVSRRKFLKIIGAAGVGATVGTKAKASPTQVFEGYPEAFSVLHDATLCVGCRSCEAACNKVNQLPEPKKPFTDLSVLETERRTDDKAFTVVNKYNAGGKTFFRKNQCNHCLEPACASACIVGAFSKSPTGAVVYDESVCIGCRYCIIACPFYIPCYEYNDPLTPRIRKCTMCHPRLKEGKLPGCVEICPTEALTFGHRDDLLKIARERFEKYPGRYVDHIYGEHEMGGTSWLYISAVPFSEIGMREDLGVKPAPELTKGALAAVPIVVGLWPVFLTGMYAMSKRKEKIAKEEAREAVKNALAVSDAATEKRIEKLLADKDKEKEVQINVAVKKALDDLKKKEQEKDSKES